MTNGFNTRKKFALLIITFLVAIPLGVYLYIQNIWIVEPLTLGSKIPSVIVSTFNGEIVKNRFFVCKENSDTIFLHNMSAL